MATSTKTVSPEKTPRKAVVKSPEKTATKTAVKAAPRKAAVETQAPAAPRTSTAPRSAKTPLAPSAPAPVRAPRKDAAKVLDTTLRPDVAEAMDADDAVLTGEQMRELVRWEAAVLGLTYDAAVAAAIKGKLPAAPEAEELREHISLLGVTS